MLAKNVTYDEMKKALKMTNKKYDNNIIWNNFRKEGNQIRFTLRVEDSSKKGSRLGFPDPETGKQRHLINACWHAHGDFFDNLLKINPDAVIKANNRTIDKNGGNWEDWNIGSLMYPLYYSEACECG